MSSEDGHERIFDILQRLRDDGVNAELVDALKSGIQDLRKELSARKADCQRMTSLLEKHNIKDR